METSRTNLQNVTRRISSASSKHWVRLLVLHLAPLVLMVAMGAAVAVHSGQDQNWDLQNYHYYDPYAFLHNRVSTDFAPGNIQSYLNPMADVMSYELITHFRPIIASALLGGIQALNVWLVYELCLLVLAGMIRGRLRYAISFAVAIVSFFGAANISEVGNTMTDNLVSIPVLLGLLLFFRAIRDAEHSDTHRRAAVLRILAFFVTGVAIGLKLTEVSFGIALLTLELFTYKGFVELVKRGVLDAAGLIAGILAAGGYWFYRMQHTFQSPVFPYYNAVFRSKYAIPVNFVDPRWMPHGIRHIVFYPFYFLNFPTLTAELPFRDHRMVILYDAVVAFFAYVLLSHFVHRLPKLRAPKKVYLLLIFIVINYVIWEKEFSYYRYLMVIEFLSVLAVTAVIWLFVRKPAIAAPATLLLLAYLAVTTHPINWGRVAWQQNFFGVSVPSHFMARNATVLLAGGQPLGYLVPSFPANVPFIRLGVPMFATPATQQLIHTKIATRKRAGSAFYGIETGDGSVESDTFSQTGFQTLTCKPLPTYANQYISLNKDYYKICRLQTSS